MPSHMGVQTIATARNSQVEFFVHYLLEKFCDQLSDLGLISDHVVESQKSYSSEIASDIWDHFISAVQINNGRKLQIWCQTTCYKGNGTGKPESNKTYEVRETLVEGISIRQLADEAPGTDVRTIHFTVGDKDYTYQWFLGMKSATYDRSIYIGQSGFDVFEALDNVLAGALTEEEKSASLEASVQRGDDIGAFITETLDELNQWWTIEGMPKSPLADLQWALVRDEIELRSGEFLDLSDVHGTDIKGRTNKLLFDEEFEEADPLIPKTAAKLLQKKPFLSAAIEAVADWSSFMSRIEALRDNAYALDNFLNRLWNAPSPLHLITRRILLRIHTNEVIAYIQDLDIQGVTEHNLYLGEHTDDQVKLISEQVKNNLQGAGINTQTELLDAINLRGKRIINQARWFESQNGTQLKPSFEYVELALRSKGFDVLSPKQAGLHAIGYHSQLVDQNVKVRPYTNLKVVCDRNGKRLAVVKAKFLRIQEFPRRCKEEAFVGLTLKNSYSESNGFSPHLQIPLVMFIDMAPDCRPPTHAVNRLIGFGWEVVFSTDELVKLLTKSISG